MFEFTTIAFEIFTGVLGMINSIIGIFLGISIFGTPLIIFFASFDFLYEILTAIFYGKNKELNTND